MAPSNRRPIRGKNTKKLPFRQLLASSPWIVPFAKRRFACRRQHFAHALSLTARHRPRPNQKETSIVLNHNRKVAADRRISYSRAQRRKSRPVGDGPFRDRRAALERFD